MVDDDGVVDMSILAYRPVCKLCNAGVDFNGMGVHVVVDDGMIIEEKLGKGDRIGCDCMGRDGTGIGIGAGTGTGDGDGSHSSSSPPSSLENGLLDTDDKGGTDA